jgi:hypothetical protein
VLDGVEAARAGGLPFRARIASAQLLVGDQDRWSVRASFRLGG